MSRSGKNKLKMSGESRFLALAAETFFGCCLRFPSSRDTSTLPAASFSRSAERGSTRTTKPITDGQLSAQLGEVKIWNYNEASQNWAQSHIFNPGHGDWVSTSLKNLLWIANQRLVISKFKFKFPRARNIEIIRNYRQTLQG